MLESAFVILREAVELLLIGSAALGYVRRVGRPSLLRFIHGGVAVGMVLGLLSVAVMVGKHLGELAEGALSAGLGLMVLGVAVSMASSGRAIEAHVQDRMQGLLEGTAGPLLMAGFCALTVFREVLETGIFLIAITDAQGFQAAFDGMLLGALLTVVVVIAYRTVSSRLSLLAVFRASTLLLCLVAIQLLLEGLGKIVNVAAQNLGVSLDGVLGAMTPGTAGYAFLSGLLTIIPLSVIFRRWWRESGSRPG